MGFSVSASTAIIFAGLFLAVGILYPAVSNGYELVDDAEVDREDARLDMRNSEINITELNGDRINVTNEGSTTLDASAVDLVINGEYQSRDDFDPEVGGDGDTDLWLPSETLEIVDDDNSDISLESGDQVRIVTEHGLSATGEI